jgi:hypoxanthine phosphoribosyltransferase
MDRMTADLARILITGEDIQSRVEEIANEISQDYEDNGNLYMIAILKGAFIFLADLTRRITIPHVVDFMAVSSYGRTAYSSGAVRFLMDLREPIEDRHVLIVEDIVDTGHTLSYLYHTLRERKPATLRTCVLLHKKREHIDVPIDYLGFEIPDVWVVGYGLDYAETYRTLPFIAELKPEVYQSESA